MNDENILLNKNRHKAFYKYIENIKQLILYDKTKRMHKLWVIALELIFKRKEDHYR